MQHLLVYISFFLFIYSSNIFSNYILIPMDLSQTDHLRAYGVMYNLLKNGGYGYWLLYYRGGSFLVEDKFASLVKMLCLDFGVSYEDISDKEENQIENIIENSNMAKLKIEKLPKIAVYTPKDKRPWDDAVTLALTYARIDYDKIYDDEILSDTLKHYDWLHLHHEDFTGQYSKFYAAFGHTKWYREQVKENEERAKKWGFKKVTDLKKAVAFKIREYVKNGGYLFAMCLAPVTLDIALASHNTDIAGSVYDGDPYDPDANEKLDYSVTFAFTNFKVNLNPYEASFGNIDYNQVNTIHRKPARDFQLFEFSAKYDPIPSILVQNHTRIIKGYYGLATSFNPDVIKSNIIILGRVGDSGEVYYLHGKLGKGRFTFLGGHDPEDYAHKVGDPPTRLEYHKNSPGYRLILNNILFPTVKTRKLKT